MVNPSSLIPVLFHLKELVETSPPFTCEVNSRRKRSVLITDACEEDVSGFNPVSSNVDSDLKRGDYNLGAILIQNSKGIWFFSIALPLDLLKFLKFRIVKIIGLLELL